MCRLLVFRSLFSFLFAFVLVAAAHAQPETVSEAEVDRLLVDEPITIETWPAWRARLLTWIGQPDNSADAAYESARAFMLEQASDEGELPAKLKEDAVAWYLLGSAQLYNQQSDDFVNNASTAEKSFRRSLELDPDFARAHRNMAMALFFQSEESSDDNAEVARHHLAEARRLDPELPLAWIEAQSAVAQGRIQDAVIGFREAVNEDPDDSRMAVGLAHVLLMSCNSETDCENAAREIKGLERTFPEEGELHIWHGLALAMGGDPRAGLAEFNVARELGTDPADILDQEAVDSIAAAAAPTFAEWAIWIATGFVVVYSVIMLLMVIAAFALARFTKGTAAAGLLGKHEGEIVRGGQVARTEGESLLARLYGLALVFGLVMFYFAIPFVVLGLIAGTLGSLFLILQAPRVPIQLIIFIVIAGAGMAWAVFKSLFVSAGSGAFGLKKTREEEPKLHALVEEVAEQVGTDAAGDIYLAPGAEIGVHQEGRGPFGMFGVKSRVLTMGLASLQHLNVDQLRAILAHEYAHFSHGDTFFSRFTHQVTLAIEQSLGGMAAAGGILNYVNPFYWFLLLYYKAYNMMAAGFSRSREFLADRMAASLYGADAFKSGLMTVATHGSYFDNNLYASVSHLLGEDKAFENVYQSFREHDEENPDDPDRDKHFQETLHAEGSMFASHPTISERLRAIDGLANSAQKDTRPVTELLQDLEATKKELTEFVTAYVHHMHLMQAAAAAE